MLYEGSHGTSVSRAKEIDRNGFRPGSGRAGSGIYFWARNEYWRELAIGWWKQQAGWSEYRADADGSCAILFVEIEASDAQVLDLENYVLKDAVAKLARERGITADPSTAGSKIIGGLFDFFIAEMERDSGVVFGLILCRVAPPDKSACPEYPIKVIGAPLALVVRKKEYIVKIRIETVG